jgi:hypothetical protein
MFVALCMVFFGGKIISDMHLGTIILRSLVALYAVFFGGLMIFDGIKSFVDRFKKSKTSQS